MSLLSVVQGACTSCAIPSPSYVLTNSDKNIARMLEFARDEVATLVSRYPWTKLLKEHVITLQNGVDRYAVPEDLRRWVHSTEWNRTSQWRVHGPLTPQQYQARESGLTNVTIRNEYQIIGDTHEGIRILPTPTSSGSVLVFMYQSKEGIRPRTWAQGITFPASGCCYYLGNKYTTATGGVAGATPPTHTTGSASDGTVTWAYSTAAYLDFTSDYDEFFLDEHLIKLGLKYRWYREHGHAFEPFLQEYRNYYADIAGAESGSQTLDMFCRSRRRSSYTIDTLRIPETGYS